MVGQIGNRCRLGCRKVNCHIADLIARSRFIRNLSSEPHADIGIEARPPRIAFHRLSPAISVHVLARLGRWLVVVLREMAGGRHQLMKTTYDGLHGNRTPCTRICKYGLLASSRRKASRVLRTGWALARSRPKRGRPGL